MRIVSGAKMIQLQKFSFLRKCALIAQLGERQTEDLKVLCSIHSQGIFIRVEDKLFEKLIQYYCTMCRNLAVGVETVPLGALGNMACFNDRKFLRI